MMIAKIKRWMIILGFPLLLFLAAYACVVGLP